MLETLQRNAGSDRGVETPPRTTQLVINDKYITEALSLLSRARSDVRVCIYAWRWYANEPEIPIQQFNIKLLQIKLKGVRVKIIVDSQAMAVQFAALGFDVKTVERDKMLHIKAICADEDSLLMGSHNLTKHATTDNYEMSILTYEFEPVAQFITYFDALWGRCG